MNTHCLLISFLFFSLLSKIIILIIIVGESTHHILEQITNVSFSLGKTFHLIGFSVLSISKHAISLSVIMSGDKG